MGLIPSCCNERKNDDGLEGDNPNRENTKNGTRAGNGNGTNKKNRLTASQKDQFKTYYFYFECFDLVYKLCDDFGLIFRPKLIVNIPGLLDIEINIMEEDDFNKSENNAESMMDSKITINKTNQMIIHNNFSTKVIYKYLLTIKGKDLYSENIFLNSLILKITMHNEYLNYPQIIIGDFHIPLHRIPDQIDEGKIPIYNKGNLIGYIFIRFQYTYVDENDNKSLNSSFIEFNEREFKLPVKPNKIIFNEYPILNYKLLDHYKSSHFIVKKLDKLEYATEQDKKYNDKKLISFYLEKTNKLPLKDISFASDLFIEAIIKCQHVVLYEFFVFLINRIRDFENNPSAKYYVKNLFLDIDNKTKDLALFDVASIVFNSKNYALLIVYYHLLNSLLIYFRKLELEENIEIKSFNFDGLCSLIIDTFGFTSKICKDYSYKIKNEKFFPELREIIYWALNTLYILIIPNINNKITNMTYLNKLYTFSYNNCLKIISKPINILNTFNYFREDTEIVSFIVRIFRKSIQLSLDYKNNLLAKNEKTKLIAKNVKNLLVGDSKNSYFLTFISISISQFKHYPEVYCNLLLIVNQLAIDYNNQNILKKLSETISMSLLRNSFELYRGSLKNICKQINLMFYKYISYVVSILKSDIADNSEINLSDENINEIVEEIKVLFKMKLNEETGKLEIKENLKEYLKNKSLELHEIFTYIGSALLRNREACIKLCSMKCYFIYHLMDFLMNIKKEKLLVELETAKTKGCKDEYIYMYISIVDNTILSLDNLITRDYKSKDYFLEMLSSMNCTKNKFRFQIIDIIHLFGTTFNFTHEKLRKCFDNFQENLETI